MNPPHPSPQEIFHRLLDESATLLAAPDESSITIPDDELHREIIVPLLPAMLGDKSIRQHWSEQTATGFPARLARHFENGDPAPRWLPGDFEIHVTASYSAGADARALADTLLSEDSLRDMTAALMNQLLGVLWPSLAPLPSKVAAEPQPEAEIAAQAVPEISEPTISTESAPALPIKITEVEGDVLQPVGEIVSAAEDQALQRPARASHALVRALCRKLTASTVQRGLIAGSKQGTGTASNAILARRILGRAASGAPFVPTGRRHHIAALQRATSPRRLPRRASL